ncbi:hypothetical protein E2C01_056052 [Portunus trituberculatus]|uniref:Uncharacterized protein n=1 Tax=Portunus trituberculatus TaxID=210409 RepID=A0A5B7GWC7_PORTR|nr:hypothetical protein [Portunus trituberculatus]
MEATLKDGSLADSEAEETSLSDATAGQSVTQTKTSEPAPDESERREERHIDSSPPMLKKTHPLSELLGLAGEIHTGDLRP